MTPQFDFPGAGRVRELDLDTGAAADLTCKVANGYTIVNLEFAPTQSHLISFDPTQKPKTCAPSDGSLTGKHELNGPWLLHAERSQMSITLDYCAYTVDDGEFGKPTPALLDDRQTVQPRQTGPGHSSASRSTPTSKQNSRATFNL